MIIIRTLRRDITKYNQLDLESDDVLEETGWKLVYGDVFRPPQKAKLLASLIGAGMQLLSATMIVVGEECRGESIWTLGTDVNDYDMTVVIAIFCSPLHYYDMAIDNYKNTPRAFAMFSGL